MIEEVWKDIPGYEGYYQISNLGRVKSLARTIDIKLKGKDTRIGIKERILKPQVIQSSGYPYVGLHKECKLKNTLIHRLLMEAYCPNPNNKPYVNHINGIKTDNRLENLEWCTKSENAIHAIKQGLTPIPPTYYGSKNPRSKLKESEVGLIKKILQSNVCSLLYISQMFHVHKDTIRYIQKERGWKHVSAFD